jgi:hypothetical protein
MYSQTMDQPEKVPGTNSSSAKKHCECQRKKTFYKTDTWMRREMRQMAITDFIFSTTISKNICLNTFTKWMFSYSLSTNTRMRLEYLELFSGRQLQIFVIAKC